MDYNPELTVYAIMLEFQYYVALRKRSDDMRRGLQQAVIYRWEEALRPGISATDFVEDDIRRIKQLFVQDRHILLAFTIKLVTWNPFV